MLSLEGGLMLGETNESSILKTITIIWIRTSCTELNTGKPRCVLPPLPGVVPPTILVPYIIACSLWNVPCFPVKPWHITFVFFVILKLGLVSVYMVRRQAPTEDPVRYWKAMSSDIQCNTGQWFSAAWQVLMIMPSKSWGHWVVGGGGD
mgnify:CR=1 FL=1